MLFCLESDSLSGYNRILLSIAYFLGIGLLKKENLSHKEIVFYIELNKSPANFNNIKLWILITMF